MCSAFRFRDISPRANEIYDNIIYERLRIAQSYQLEVFFQVQNCKNYKSPGCQQKKLLLILITTTTTTTTTHGHT